MEPISIRHILALLRLRGRLVLLVALPCIVLGGLIIQSRPTLYRAVTKIFLSPDSRAVSPQANAVAMGEKLHTLEALVQSYPLYQEIRKQLGEEYVGQRDGFLGKLNTLFSLMSAPADSDDPENDADYVYFRKHVVFTSDFVTENFELGYESPDPDISLKVAETLVGSLVNLNAKLESERAKSYRELVQRKLTEAKKTGEDINKRIGDFVKTYGFVERSDLNEAMKSSRNRAADTARAQTNVAELEIKLKEGEAKVASLKRKVKARPAPSKPKANIQAEIARLEAALLSSSRYETPGPEADGVRRQLRELYAELHETESGGEGGDAGELDRAIASTSELRTELKIARMNARRSQEANAIHADKGVGMVSTVQQQWSELLNERDSNIKLISSLQDESMTASVAGDEKYARMLTIQTKPTLDTQDAHTFLKLLVMIAVILGGVGFAFIVYDVQTSLVVVPGQLMAISEPLFAGVFPHLNRLSAFTFSARCSKDQRIARLGFTVHRFLHHPGVDRGKLVAFCGNKRATGVTITTWGHAIALADIGKSVLVVDCDFRRAKLATQALLKDTDKFVDGGDLGALVKKSVSKGDPGKILVTHLFEKEVPLGEAVHFLEQTLGPQMATLQGAFDYILLDMGPADNIDSLALIAYCDAVVVCCRYGQTRLESVVDTANLVHNYAPEGCKYLSVLTDSPYTRQDALKVGHGPGTINLTGRDAA